MTQFNVNALNEMAIELMRSARPQEAACLLSKAMAQINFDYSTPDTSMTQSGKRARRTSLEASSLLHYTWICPPKHTEQVSPGNTFDFYPIVFSVEALCEEVSPAMFNGILAPVMQCNLAVLYHQTALNDGCSRRLDQAVKLYKAAVKTLRRWADESTAFALFVATANMAHIHSHFHDFQRAKNCFDVAIQIISCVEEECLTEVVLDSVFFHSMSMSIPNLASAA
eukprot:scaffold923_cov171-Amphora_coffeaeformis.AAC.2